MESSPNDGKEEKIGGKERSASRNNINLRFSSRKRYSREEVDGVRKEKERLTTDHQPREIIDGRLTCLFLTLCWTYMIRYIQQRERIMATQALVS
jgi:hypothetical protein